MTTAFFKRHPLSEICGPMDPDTFVQLVERMGKSGYRKSSPVILYEGAVLDGWHRYQAAIAGGLEPVFEQFDGSREDAIALVMDAHTRRDWSKSQRALAEVKLVEWSAKKPEPGSGSKTEAQMAEAAGVDERTIRQAKTVVRNAIPQVQEAVHGGDLSLKRAAQIAQLPKSEQKDALATPRDKTAEQPSKGKTWKAVKPEVGATKEAVAELNERIAILTEDHERIEARLAVHFMEGTEDEKQAAADLIAQQAERIKALEHEVTVLKDSRDTYMRECAELRRQCGIYRGQLAKRAA
jgi:uncharacterized small protein (DUF1192 family)